MNGEDDSGFAKDAPPSRKHASTSSKSRSARRAAAFRDKKAGQPPPLDLRQKLSKELDTGYASNKLCQSLALSTRGVGFHSPLIFTNVPRLTRPSCMVFQLYRASVAAIDVSLSLQVTTFERTCNDGFLVQTPNPTWSQTLNGYSLWPKGMSMYLEGIGTFRYTETE